MLRPVRARDAGVVIPGVEGNVLHASAYNRTDTWRRAVIFHYASAKARSENEQLNAEVSLEID